MSSRYSGSVSFSYEIERYKDKESGEFILENDLPPDDDEGFEFEYTLILLTIKGSSYYDPGSFSGPPENSYPEEEDTEIESITDSDGNDWEYRITESERSYILEDIQQNCELQFRYCWE
jgi:hypothetical protein